MPNYKIQEMEKSAKEQYVEYIDRCRRTTTKSRLDIHTLLNTQNIGRFYGLTDKDLEEFTIIFTDELKNKEE